MSTSKRDKSARDLDPYRKREARRYENPIASREYILRLIGGSGAPLAFQELAARLELAGDAELEALRRRLGAMERDGQLLRNRRGGYCPVNSKDLIVGRIIGHPDGFGFLRPENGADDLFLSSRQMRTLLHDDRAVVRVTGVDRRGRREASLVEVLERNTQRVVGRLYQEAGLGFVVPDNKRIHHEVVIPEGKLGGATPGQIVVVEIEEQPTQWSQPIGRICEILGEHMAPGMETDVAIRSHGIPLEWPQAVSEEIADIDEVVEESAKQGRVDLRHLPLVTIDGADARDFDDAVYCESKPKGWRLLVCIADVSSYVAVGSALDEEARNRGNSVYFPDRVVPMLPEVLSNGLCSLNPAVDRLCMACEIYVNREGGAIRSRFFEAVMRSHARLTYDEVAAILDGEDRELLRRYAPLVSHLKELFALYQAAHRARQERGAIDFDTVETQILFDAQQKVQRIVPLQRNHAHRLIEECMLLANVAAARLLLRKRIPALYRIHEGPQQEKLLELREFLAELGLQLHGGMQPEAADFAALLESARGRPDFRLVQTVMLRSLSQAVYSSQNVGHFGLSYPAYTHFTSPIRRYPDLVVHRAIKHTLAGGKGEDFVYSQPKLQSLGEHCSSTERRADEATRDAIAWLKCEYMLDKIGDELPGIISGVNSFGLFVELDDIFIDGLVHITALDNDFYHFDPIGHRLTGERSGIVYRLGDPLRVRVAAVNLDERKIDFVLAQEAPAGRARGKRGVGLLGRGRSRKDKGSQRGSPREVDSVAGTSRRAEQRPQTKTGHPVKRRKAISKRRAANRPRKPQAD